MLSHSFIKEPASVPPVHQLKRKPPGLIIAVNNNPELINIPLAHVPRLLVIS